jgi:hypothetical protein
MSDAGPARRTYVLTPDVELAEAVGWTLRESRRFLNRFVIRYEAAVGDFTGVLPRKDCWGIGPIGAGHTPHRCV